MGNSERVLPSRAATAGETTVSGELTSLSCQKPSNGSAVSRANSSASGDEQGLFLVTRRQAQENAIILGSSMVVGGAVLMRIFAERG